MDMFVEGVETGLVRHGSDLSVTDPTVILKEVNGGREAFFQ